MTHSMFRAAGAPALYAVLAVPTLADAAGQPITVTPSDIQWKDDPRAQGVKAAVLAGDPKQAGTSVGRVKLEKGAKLQPHTHPDTRYGTVLSGVIHIEFGTTFDAAGMKQFPAGSLVVIPANTPHYVWSKDGEAVIQDVGTGPTGTTFLGGEKK